MARALQLSIDQLAELLTESGNADTKADTTRAPSADTEVTIPVLLPEVQAEVRPGRAQFEDLIRPQGTETVEALRRALRSAGVSPEELDAMLLVGRSSQGPLVSAELDRPVAVDADPQAAIVPEPVQAEVPHRPSLTAVPLDPLDPLDPVDVEFADVWRRRARSRRFTRFAAAGVLALVLAEGAASVPFISSHSGPIPPAATGTPTPVAAIPAPDPGNGKDSTGADHTTPAAPNTPADGPATPAAAVVPAPHTTRATSNGRTTSRSKPPTARTPPPPPTSAVPAEAYARYREAVLNARDQHRAHLRPESPPRPDEIDEDAESFD